MRPAGNFNRPAPPHFKGFDPNGVITRYERHLPHWRQPGATYFVTFRLADSIPQNVVEYLIRLRAEIFRATGQSAEKGLQEEYYRQTSSTLEESLHQGSGNCVFNDMQNVAIVKHHLEYGAESQHFIGCGVIMPNHVHLLIRPFDGFELEDILGQVKNYSSIKINRRMGTRGTLWQNESYDRIIRDEEHLYRVIQYIGRNPSKIGHPCPELIRWVHPSWITAGWGFEDSMAPHDFTG